MKWNDLIEEIMKKHNGSASLQLLYKETALYKDLPEGDWHKTLRGVLYRDAKNGRFKKIGLGVFALANFDDNNSAYNIAVKSNSINDYYRNVSDIHSAIEGMLLELGNFFDYRTYTCDFNKKFDNKSLKDLSDFSEIPNFTYKELTDIVSKIDVIWFSKNKLPFPKYIIEVEASTDFSNSMLKMYQILDFDSKFFLIASDTKKNIYMNRLNREPFNSKKNKYNFRSFEDVFQLYFKSVEQNELKVKFLEG